MQEARRCGGLAYDTMFRQQAAGNTAVDWSRLNGTLYFVLFLAQASRGTNCSLCMESEQGDEDCVLVPVTSTPRQPGLVVPPRCKNLPQREGHEQVGGHGSRSHLRALRRDSPCFLWNQGECRYPQCKYRYCCVRCGGDHPITCCRSPGNKRDRERGPAGC